MSKNQVQQDVNDMCGAQQFSELCWDGKRRVTAKILPPSNLNPEGAITFLERFVSSESCPLPRAPAATWRITSDPLNNPQQTADRGSVNTTEQRTMKTTTLIDILNAALECHGLKRENQFVVIHGYRTRWCFNFSNNALICEVPSIKDYRAKHVRQLVRNRQVKLDANDECACRIVINRLVGAVVARLAEVRSAANAAEAAATLEAEERAARKAASLAVFPHKSGDYTTAGGAPATVRSYPGDDNVDILLINLTSEQAAAVFAALQLTPKASAT